MATQLQLSTTLRNAMAAVYETTIGTSPKLILRTGAQPANCAAADTGSFLAILTPPSDWMGTTSGGAVTIANGPWTGTVTNSGTVAHYRLKDSTATSTDNTGVTHEQGTVGTGTFDLSLDNLVLAAGQNISISTWTRTIGGA